MNYRNEALYMTLSGYAKEIIDNNDMSINGIPYDISQAMIREFRRDRNLYSKSQRDIIVKLLNKLDKEFLNTPTTPTLLLVVTLYYLLYEVEHTRTRLLFGHYGNEVKQMWNSVENSIYKDRLLEHLEFIEKFAYKEY